VIGLTATASCHAPAPPAPGPPPPGLSTQLFNARAPSGLCAPAQVASCALDNVGGVAATAVMRVKRLRGTRLIGWAADADSGTIPPVVLIELVSGDVKTGEEKFYAPASRTTRRPDRAEAVKALPLVDAGYDLLASFKDVPRGEYAVNVVQVNVSGNVVTCDTQRKLKVE
jgi:hypothetical protein